MYEKSSLYFFHGEYYLLYLLHSRNTVMASHGHHSGWRQPSVSITERTLSLLGSCGDSIRTGLAYCFPTLASWEERLRVSEPVCSGLSLSPPHTSKGQLTFTGSVLCPWELIFL